METFLVLQAHRKALYEKLFALGNPNETEYKIAFETLGEIETIMQELFPNCIQI